jgi:cupin superfamily acireductone dioxygenase involved in methionine salvage
MKKKPIYLAVLNFNTVTVNLYCISRIDQERISKTIDEEDDDSIVLEFMREHEHRESECHYMFSDKPIPAFSEGEPIWE